MPVNAALSAIIILAVALTTFGTRVFPFVSRSKRNTASDPVSGKSTDSGGDRDVSSLLPKEYTSFCIATWHTRISCCGSDSRTSCMET